VTRSIDRAPSLSIRTTRPLSSAKCRTGPARVFLGFSVVSLPPSSAHQRERDQEERAPPGHGGTPKGERKLPLTILVEGAPNCSPTLV
jgi:hypothetical protein